MTRRRKFLRTLAAFGITAPFASHLKPAGRSHRSRKEEGSIPVILCSRGEKWGRKVLEPGWKILHDRGNVLDAVEVSANVVELDPEDTSVGYGGLPNEDGVVSLDASIMYGPTHNCGGVAALENIKKACSVARLVMERTDHIMLVGRGALDFAKAHGFKEEDLLTDYAREYWLRWKENLSNDDDWFPPKDGVYNHLKRPRGTINVLGISPDGDIAGITTTSGLFGKIPGRIGDSPIIGAGLYLDNAIGAAGATGRGEEVIRTCGSFYLVHLMGQGMSPQEACEEACKKIININGGSKNIDFTDKFIAVNKVGEVGCAAIMGSATQPPSAAYINSDGFHVLEGKYFIENKED
jgi:N4-(beta-N-acetylglucosaminyl)-L-asparaginase